VVVIVTKGLTKKEDWKEFGEGYLNVFKNWENCFFKLKNHSNLGAFTVKIKFRPRMVTIQVLVGDPFGIA
jgi:hypothetical protein